ncbi:hypothetical protein SDC9_201908 [bioreactor metagenome]|uniref:Uncharacterized protein n=1 Tax=bioreactor metagenome TaxID=1076179 RepID=A0A645IS75_9ZZZZ
MPFPFAQLFDRLIGGELACDDRNRKPGGAKRPHTALQYVGYARPGRSLDAAELVYGGHRVVCVRPTCDCAVERACFPLDGHRRGAQRKVGSFAKARQN